MIIMHTKFEVSTFIHYEDMKGNAKCIETGVVWRLGSPQVTGNVTIH